MFRSAAVIEEAITVLIDAIARLGRLRWVVASASSQSPSVSTNPSDAAAVVVNGFRRSNRRRRRLLKATAPASTPSVICPSSKLQSLSIPSQRSRAPEPRHPHHRSRCGCRPRRHGCNSLARRCAGAVSVTVTVRVPVLGVLCGLVVDCPVAVFIDVVQVADLDRVGVDGGVAIITVSALSDPAFFVAAAVCGSSGSPKPSLSVSRYRRTSHPRVDSGFPAPSSQPVTALAPQNKKLLRCAEWMTCQVQA